MVNVRFVTCRKSTYGSNGRIIRVMFKTGHAANAPCYWLESALRMKDLLHASSLASPSPAQLHRPNGAPDLQPVLLSSITAWVRRCYESDFTCTLFTSAV